VKEGKQSFLNIGGDVTKVFPGGGKAQLLATHD
jgi:hypothetical protein